MCHKAKALRLMVLYAPIWRVILPLSGYIWESVIINRTSSWAEEIKKQSLNDNDHDHGSGDIGIPLRKVSQSGYWWFCWDPHRERSLQNHIYKYSCSVTLGKSLSLFKGHFPGVYNFQINQFSIWRTGIVERVTRNGN